LIFVFGFSDISDADTLAIASLPFFRRRPASAAAASIRFRSAILARMMPPAASQRRRHAYADALFASFVFILILRHSILDFILFIDSELAARLFHYSHIGFRHFFLLFRHYFQLTLSFAIRLISLMMSFHYVYCH